MKSSEENDERSGRSWRDIRQEVSSPAMSRRGRRRRFAAWCKVAGICVSLGFVGWAIYSLVHSWETDRAALASAVHSEPVRDVVLITDGFLTKKWVTDTLALPAGISLMALDLEQLREKLLVSGQVRVAVLTRSFPDKLVVTLQERTPVARLQTSEGQFTLPRQYMVAKDGVVYEGVGYEKTLVATLPWLDGVRVVKAAGGGFAPIDGMTEVSALLTTAQEQAPHLYRGWLIVSLARLQEADEILVKSQDVAQIVFSRKRSFFKQIAQLDYVVDATHVLPDPAVQSVNLTLEGQVPVRLQGTPDELAKAVKPEFTSQPSSSQRRTKRDL